MFPQRQRHRTPWLRTKHKLIMAFMFLFVVANAVFVFFFPRVPYYVWMEPDTDDALAGRGFYEFVVCVVLSIAGAWTGKIIYGFGPVRRHSVQWGTFRVNLSSCIIIGAIHNILLLRQYFPFGDSPYFVIFFERGISQFCGSESSFAGVIDETTTLFNSRNTKFTALLNFLFNVILCTVVFFIVILSVRVLFFYYYTTNIF